MLVSIPIGEYADLLGKAEVFDALQAAGVDNWEGYSYALESLNEEDE